MKNILTLTALVAGGLILTADTARADHCPSGGFGGGYGYNNFGSVYSPGFNRGFSNFNSGYRTYGSIYSPYRTRIYQSYTPQYNYNRNFNSRFNNFNNRGFNNNFGRRGVRVHVGY